MSSKSNVFAPHLDYLLALARRLARNEADARDLVQDTIVRAIEGMRQSQVEPMNMRGWLHVVMRRHWLNVARQRRAHANVALQHEPADFSMVETRASFPQLARAWNRLPESAQRIAEQCLIYDEPYESVSDRVGVAKATIATSIYRTRRQLRARLFED